MRRPRPGVGSELLPVSLILIGLAGTLGLVIAMHRNAASTRPAARPGPSPPVVVAAAPRPEPVKPKEPPAPPPVVVQPPPEDPTRKALAALKNEEAEQLRATVEADRKAVALENSRQAAVAESQRWRRRESLIRSQINGIAQKAGALEQEADALAMERDVLARERDAAKAAIAKARGKDGGYAVLPHKGANGTWQRPVVIECKNGTATLQPSGLSFTLLDMSALAGMRSSPLVLAVARELIKASRATSPDGEPITPYIYFIVRPDGVRPYYEARGRLEPLGIAFGYELVEQDWEIEFPDFDELASWDNAAAPRFGQGGSAAGSGGAAGTGRGAMASSNDFVWPADRPGGVPGQAGRTRESRGDGGDSALWPSRPSGGAGGASGLTEGPSGRGLGGRGLPAAGPGGAPPSLDRLDVENMIRKGEGLSNGLDLPPMGGGGGSSNPARASRRGQAGAGSGLVPLDSDGLPGFDRTDGTGDGPAGPSPAPSGSSLPPLPPGSGSGFDPSRFTNTRPGASPRNGRGTLPLALSGSGTPGTVKPGAPVPPGRTLIEPSLLAQASEDDAFSRLEARRAEESRFGSGDSPSGSPASTGGSSGATGQPATSSGSPPPRGSSGGTGQPSSSIGSPPQGSIGVPSFGAPSGGSASGDKRPKPTKPPPPPKPPTRVRSIEVPLDLTVACGPDSVTIHPGGYRLTASALRKPGTLQGDLELIVRNHQLIDPMVRPRPRVQFLIEPGGTDTYWQARRQTVLAGLSWPVTIKVAGTPAPQVFPKERF
jgi:hypothetical protein